MKKLMMSVLAVIILASCGGSSAVNQAIGQIEKAIEKVEKNKGNMTEADWETLEKEVEVPMKTLADALEAGKVGAMDKLKIITLMGKWTTVLMDAGIGEIEKQTGIDREDFDKELKKAAEELETATSGQ